MSAVPEAMRREMQDAIDGLVGYDLMGKPFACPVKLHQFGGIYMCPVCGIIGTEPFHPYAMGPGIENVPPRSEHETAQQTV